MGITILTPPERTRGMLETEGGLVMPPEVRRQILHRCTIPVEGGGVCGAVFFRGQQKEMERHVMGLPGEQGCAARNAGAINALRKSVARPYELPQDEELAAWVAQNRAGLISGRVHM